MNCLEIGWKGFTADNIRALCQSAIQTENVNVKTLNLVPEEITFTNYFSTLLRSQCALTLLHCYQGSRKRVRQP